MVRRDKACQEQLKPARIYRRVITSRYCHAPPGAPEQTRAIRSRRDTGKQLMAIVRPLVDADLPEARRIVRHAFGTFMGAPDLDAFWTDRDYVYTRCGAEHIEAFAAED